MHTPWWIKHQVRNNSNQSSFISNIILLITLILRALVWPLRRIADFLFPPKEFDGVTNTADQAARAFVSFFEKQYLRNPSIPNTNTISENGSNNIHTNVENFDTTNTTPQHPNPFQPTGYAKTLVESYRQQKLMLVYLHSPLHPEAEPFCQRILCHPQVLELLNHNILTWGGSIHTADGARVAEMLNVSAYPYVALLACGGTGGSRVDMLWKMEGNSRMDMALDSFLRGVTTVLRGFQAILAEAETRRLRREEEVRLR